MVDSRFQIFYFNGSNLMSLEFDGTYLAMRRKLIKLKIKQSDIQKITKIK